MNSTNYWDIIKYFSSVFQISVAMQELIAYNYFVSFAAKHTLPLKVAYFSRKISYVILIYAMLTPPTTN